MSEQLTDRGLQLIAITTYNTTIIMAVLHTTFGKPRFTTIVARTFFGTPLLIKSPNYVPNFLLYGDDP